MHIRKKLTKSALIILSLLILISLIAVASAEFSITQNSPVDGYNTTDTTPSLDFTVAGNETSYSCELFLDGVGYGVHTTISYQENADSTSTIANFYYERHGLAKVITHP
jgi:hypothetical protein